MPSPRCDAFLALFRHRPQLAAEVLRDVLAFPVPEHDEARIELVHVVSTLWSEHEALAVTLSMDRVPVLGVVVDVQLAPDHHKHFTWPAYAASLRMRLRCASVVLVVAPDERVARWCRQPIHLGGGNLFTPLVASSWTASKTR